MFQKSRTSIFLPLLLLAGVVTSYHIKDEEDGDILRPFVSSSQRRRICVELCLSGLGGTPCGDQCADITPLDLPIQSNSNNKTENSVAKNITRNSACNVLCANDLGTPLCVCDDVNVRKAEETDYLQICSVFCMYYNYRINGCQKCKVYESSLEKNSGYGLSMRFTKLETTVDWAGWCLDQCSKGNGGAACNCDRLPLK